MYLNAIDIKKYVRQAIPGGWLMYEIYTGYTQCSNYQIRWLMKPERKNFLGKSLLDPSVLVVCVAPNRPSP